jgi:hypothetical protein
MNRHDREWTAKAARAAGGGSREGVRQAVIVKTYAPELADQVMAGTLSLNVAYRQVIGDDRVPLYLKLDKDTDDLIRMVAAAAGVSRQQIVLAVIKQWIDAHEEDC